MVSSSTEEPAMVPTPTAIWCREGHAEAATAEAADQDCVKCVFSRSKKGGMSTASWASTLLQHNLFKSRRR